MYGGFDGGMGGFDGGMKGGFGGFSRGMGNPFRGGMGGIQDRMYRGQPGGGMTQIQGGSSRGNLDQFNLEQALRSGFLGRAAVEPQQNRIPETVGTWGSVPKPPAPDALTGGPAEVINKGMTKPYIEPAAPAAPQIPSIQEKEAKLNDQLRYSKPGSADEAYNQELAMYNSPQYAAYYNNLPPSTRAFMNKPGDPARGRYLAEQARSNYQAFGPGGGFKAGGIASLRRYADGGTAKEGTGDDDNVNTTPTDPYVPKPNPVGVKPGLYKPYPTPAHTVYSPRNYFYNAAPWSAIGKNDRPAITRKTYSIPTRGIRDLMK
jgi:hypothetical protein